VWSSQNDVKWTLGIVNNPGSRPFAEGLIRYLQSAAYLPHRQPMFSNVRMEPRSKDILVHFVHEQPHPAVISGIELRGVRHGVFELFETGHMKGLHMGNGVLAIKGAGVRPHAVTTPIFAPDIAPTIAYMMNLPLAK